ncbi:TOG array regulator of axonemal microtubules protein 2 [Pantherophis guttatus]|uniref:TOG array regulator of axonemal microtubules protein 2 n=1 Tax=Pantherophis guttatus TaxID=94885 RepID=A0A6P9CLV1_PANGU|nr:TOG array regulator of axonemal microtubules protein 2 [Pantherophis guttatus]XP_034283874.1 TOG array regulator of axonemal microtubules protein 2 [Pantherophis guttatus]
MATHDDFMAGKYQAQVAIYCGSIPKLKSGCKSSRGGSIDSTLQLQGNGWRTTDEASVLKTQSCLWGSKGKPPDVSSLESWDNRNGLQKNTDSTIMNGSSQTPNAQPKYSLSELEINSAAMETAQIKDKLKKRRMSEGLLASKKGLLDKAVPKEPALKPAISRSASQRLLVTSKPMPPIQSIPNTPETNRPQETEQQVRENGSGSLQVEGINPELTSIQQIVHGPDENPKKSLGAALIPPIPKLAKACEENSQKAAELFPSLPQADCVSSTIDECSKTRSLSKSGNGEDNSQKTLETGLSEPAFQNGFPAPWKVVGGSLASLLLPATSSLCLAKEDLLSNPHLLKDDEWKESNGRIHVTISKSAQEKMRQKQLKEIEFLRKEKEKEKGREKERSTKIQEQQSRNVLDGSSWLNHNGATPVTLNLSNPCRASVGVALRKRVNRPSLPSIPVISQESNFLRHASANSLPANLQHSPEWEEDLVNRDAFEIRPLSHPEHELIDALKWLNSNDWHLKEKGLFNIICLATCHSEVLQGRLHDVSLAATKEVSNLRSKVSRFAIGTLAELFKAMKKHMDQEVEEISRVLLQKAGDTSEFIQKAADQSLGIMAQSVTPSRAMTALMANGVTHRNPLIRKCAAGHLLTVMEQIGAEKLLSGNRESTELLVQTLVKMAQDCHQDTRCYGRKMLNMLMCHSKFDGYLKQNVPSHDLRDVMAAIKQKGTEDSASQASSAKSYRGSKTGSLTISLDSLSSGEGSTSDVLNFSQPAARCSSLRSIEVMEQLKELNKLLVAKEFQIRIDGIALLMDHCKKNPHFVSSNIVQIFDTFALRLQDSNKKVNQYALESVVSMIPVLKNGFNPVLFSVVTIVMDNLNSKNSGIYSAAVKILDTMITYLDNLLLLQIFASRVRFLTGRALQDITDRLAGLVAVAYPRKPLVVERYILPVLWYFLNNMIGNGVLPGKSGNVRTVVSKLAKSLHKQMGLKLEEYVCNQPQHVIKLFQDLLDMDLQ